MGEPPSWASACSRDGVTSPSRRPVTAPRPPGAEPTVAGSGSASKQVRSPVWQAPLPTWSTLTSRVSPSQSSATDFTHCCEPEVSPLTQYSCRLRDQ
jgi:hypothetical protein